jgi:phosphatidylserine/phosphatidylglycerophosphate/cardiolipin synthase-like enzyme
MTNEEMYFEAVVGSEFPKKVIPLIEEAKKSIKIIVFDWRWYPMDIGSSCQLFNQTIIRVAQKGLDVKVLTNVSDVVKVLRDNKVSAKKPESKKLLHSKIMIIDDEIIILGSHNYTKNAFELNHEISVIIKAKFELERFIKYFDYVWQS